MASLAGFEHCRDCFPLGAEPGNRSALAASSVVIGREHIYLRPAGRRVMNALVERSHNPIKRVETLCLPGKINFSGKHLLCLNVPLASGDFDSSYAVVHVSKQAEGAELDPAGWPRGVPCATSVRSDCSPGKAGHPRARVGARPSAARRTQAQSGAVRVASARSRTPARSRRRRPQDGGAEARFAIAVGTALSGLFDKFFNIVPRGTRPLAAWRPRGSDVSRAD